MSKQEQLAEYIVQDIVEFVVDDIGVECEEAMRLFYQSKTFEKLQDIETGLYCESSAYVYGMYQDERNFGEFVQNEI